MLASATFSSLTKITVRFNTPATADTVNTKEKQVQSFLNIINAPMLQHLDTQGIKIGLLDMEQLHKNAVNLQHLTLGYLDFSVPESSKFAFLKNDTLKSLNIMYSHPTISLDTLKE